MSLRWIQKTLFIGLFTFSITAIASNIDMQFFSGKIQPSSLNGQTAYGPAYESLVRRTVNQQDGQIFECVLQNAEMFSTTMNRTDQPLVFSVKDSNNSFTGTLTFADQSLQSWSYDIQVSKPNQGHLSGSLPEHGAKIDLEKKTMSIKKIWNDQVLITEEYKAIDQVTYDKKIKAALASHPAIVIPENCR